MYFASLLLVTCCLISHLPSSLHPCMSFSDHLARSLSSISLWTLGSDLWTGVCKFLTAKDCLMSSTAACGDGPTCTAITSCVPSRPASTPSTSRRMKSALTPTTTSGWRRQVWKLTAELPETFWQYVLFERTQLYSFY